MNSKRGISTIIAILIIAAMAFVPAKAMAAEQTTPSGINYSDICKSMDDYAEEYEAGLASFSAAVFDKSGIIATGSYGYADIENGVQADENTVYEWGSTSKLLVWVSVMQLYERGLVDLDKDIREYLPEGFLTKLQYPDEKITLVNLMNHNAGFQESMYENQMADEDQLYESLEEAVRKCECYQTYHVGEHTAYSNWGVSLAAYIVECVSGKDYVTYVHENIFEPLGMAHTSIDMHAADNEWVKEQREKINCYERYRDSKDNKDLGECRTWVQLFPAGAAMGTVDDLAAFAQGFVADDCPFFEKNETRDIMVSPSSYYGDSDIAKNCHGMWTSDFKVQTMGHGGNTMGMTANLQFDPESGLGIVVLANEPGETMFCTGLCEMLFGDIMESDMVASAPATDHPDASGAYYMARTLDRGFGSATKYSGGFFLAKATDDPDVFDMPMAGGMQLVHIGDKMWLQKSPNGTSIFCYETTDADGNLALEMETTDFMKLNVFGTAASYGFILFGAGCILTLLIKLAAIAIRRIRGRSRIITTADRQITLQQIIQGVSGIIFFLLIMALGTPGYGFAVFSCIMACLLGVVSLVNAGLLIRNTICDHEIMKKTAAKQYIWAGLAVMYCVIIIWFQLYDFVHI